MRELHRYQNVRYNDKNQNVIFTLNHVLSKTDQQKYCALFRQYIIHVRAPRLDWHTCTHPQTH